MIFPEVLLTVICLIHISSIWAIGRNNVCRNFKDYFNNINQNPNCWFDSDIDATPEQIAKKYGFILERYMIRTEDKYILTTFRLKSLDYLYGEEVVFLQHGLGADGVCFMANGNKSIAFFLSNKGYDVWLGNYRGSEFSSHEYLTRDDTRFWDFSLSEHAIDLSANFKFIAGKTKKKITFIGHSMGGTGFGIHSSIRTDESKDIIKHAILISPGFYLGHAKGILNLNFVKRAYPLLTILKKNMNINVLLATNSFEKRRLERFCFHSFENGLLCQTLFNKLYGYYMTNPIPPDKLRLALNLMRNLGVKDISHYAQIILSGGFRMYDYGPKENKIRYNASSPSAYNLGRIPIPTTWIYSEYDGIVDKLDLISTFKMFRKPNWNIFGIPYNHANWLLTSDVDKDFYPLLLKVMDNEHIAINDSVIHS